MESSIIDFSFFLSKAAIEIIETSAGLKIHESKTIQRIPNVKIAGDIGSFVSFQGDYQGIVVLNFTGDAALEIVTAYLVNMGMPKSEIPSSYTTDDVRSNIGEFVNQIMGKFRTFIQERYDLSASSNIPAVISIATPIGLIFESAHSRQDCVRICLSTPASNRFYIELSMEHINLIELSRK